MRHVDPMSPSMLRAAVLTRMSAHVEQQMFQDVRTFTELNLANPACSAASPCTAMETYSDAIANSFTTTYTTGSAVAKAQGEKIPGPLPLLFAAGAESHLLPVTPGPVRPCRLPTAPSIAHDTDTHALRCIEEELVSKGNRD